MDGVTDLGLFAEEKKTFYMKKADVWRCNIISLIIAVIIIIMIVIIISVIIKITFVLVN